MSVKPIINYKISTYPSKFAGYQSKKGGVGTITMYIVSIWSCAKNLPAFIRDLIWTGLIERICIETAFQRIRIKGGKCSKKYDGMCVMEYIANEMGA